LFAHSKEELKLIPKSSLYKTKLCQTFKNDICPFGVKCLYIHFQKNEYELFLIKFMNLARKNGGYGEIAINKYKEFKDWIYHYTEDGIITERFYKENVKELENWILEIDIQEKDFINELFNKE